MMKFIVLAVLAFFLMACQQETPVPGTAPDGQAQEEYVTTSLGFAGEWMDVEHETATRATVSNDLYWLEVYYAAENSSNYSFYGYEVFDDPQYVKVKMLKGYKYEINVSVVKNGKTLIWKDIQKGFYCYPVARSGEQFLCSNQFVRSSSNNQGLSTSYGRCRLQGVQNNYSETEFPDLERYFGKLTGYVPTENGKMAINLYRLYFGVKFQVEGFKKDGGVLKVEYETGTSDYTMPFSLTPDNAVLEWKAQWPYDIAKVPAMLENSQKVMSERQFRVKWTSADGAVKDKEIGVQKIFLERNKMNVIRICLTPVATKAVAKKDGQTSPVLSSISGEVTNL